MDCSPRSGIDLHLHSTASDGTLSPAELLAMASDLGIAAIAITDHDTTEGATAALRHGIPSSLHFLTGVEISADPPASCPGGGSLHILGYGFDCGDPQLGRMLEQLVASRRNRNPEIVRRLKRLGMDISLEEVARAAGKCQLGRPHIARMLVQKGMVASMNEAFDRFLGTGKAAYVEKRRVSCKEAVDCIRSAGGVAVLAHPGLLPVKRRHELEALVDDLKAIGLGGVEVHYPRHSPEQTAFFERLAVSRGLLVTGGTDYHGAISPDLCMGTGTGNFQVPFSLYEQLVDHLQTP